MLHLSARLTCALLFSAILSLGGIAQTASGAGWKAGTARVAITPKEPVWMAGYGSRNHPSEGAVHDLWAKALVLEDPNGKRLALVTLDVCGVGRDLSNRVRDALKSRLGLGREQVVLACSHTHSGPVVGTNLITMYKVDDEQRQRIREYGEWLEREVIGVTVRAADRLEPVLLAWGTGRADFAVNRRNNKESDVIALREQLGLQGPVDHDVPVLRVSGADGRSRAVVFGYACHCTVMDFYRFCGDYAGFAQIALEAKNPGMQAMFVAGCGGDQNPLPRRGLEFAESYGRQLADAVQRVLSSVIEPIASPVECAYTEIALGLAELPSREQVEKDAAASDFFIASRAKALLETIRTKGELAKTYPYPIEVWRLGDLTWIFLGGEVVVDYSLRIKRNLGGSHTWVSAYCNDVCAYIPSLRVLKEGGYEGASSMIYYALPTTWSEAVEKDIIEAVAKTVAATRPRP